MLESHFNKVTGPESLQLQLTIYSRQLQFKFIYITAKFQFVSKNITSFLDSEWLISAPPVSVYHGSESTSFFGPKTWNILPDGIKQQTPRYSFIKSVQKWKPKDCPCELCKVYINASRFVLCKFFIFISLSRH